MPGYSNDAKPMPSSFTKDTKPNSKVYLVSKWADTVATWDSATYSWSEARSVTFTNDTEPS
jgi:hypothetical protein